VKRVVQELKARFPEVSAAARPKRASKLERRKLIDAAIRELLVLAGQTAIADLLSAKIEGLHRQIRSLFAQ
jgi:hypothetical protein